MVEVIQCNKYNSHHRQSVTYLRCNKHQNYKLRSLKLLRNAVWYKITSIASSFTKLIRACRTQNHLTMGHFNRDNKIMDNK